MSDKKCLNGYLKLFASAAAILVFLGAGFGVYYQGNANETDIKELKDDLLPRVRNIEHRIIRIAERLGIEDVDIK